MSWIKEANKIGRYMNTYRRFRIYRTSLGFTAIYKNMKFKNYPSLETIGNEIDMAHLQYKI